MYEKEVAFTALPIYLIQKKIESNFTKWITINCNIIGFIQFLTNLNYNKL